MQEDHRAGQSDRKEGAWPWHSVCKGPGVAVVSSVCKEEGRSGCHSWQGWLLARPHDLFHRAGFEARDF